MLAPEAVADPAPVVKLAETALAGRPDDPAVLTTMGAALYRAGQFEPAAKRLKEAVEARPGMAAAWFLLALAQQRLGQTDEAKTALAKGVARMDGSTEARADPPPLSWRQRVEWQALGARRRRRWGRRNRCAGPSPLSPPGRRVGCEGEWFQDARPLTALQRNYLRRPKFTLQVGKVTAPRERIAVSEAGPFASVSRRTRIL